MESTATLPRRISVAHLGPDPAGDGGMAAVLRGLLTSSLANRYDLEMIVTYRSPQRLARLAIFLGAIVRLFRWSLRRGSRLVHIHTAARGSLYRKGVCVFAGRLLLRPVVMHVHAGKVDIEAFASRLGPLRRWFLRRALLSATRLLAVSAESARAMERCFGVDGILVVPNVAPAAPESRPPPGEVEGEPRVLYVGGFANPVKGGDVLVEAVATLAAEFPRVSFVLAGPGEAPEALVALEARWPNVRWVGWLDEEGKREELAHCATFVLPSLSEGLPVALLEAMAWGRAIVAAEVGGVPEAVTGGIDAIVVPPGDPAALSDAIRRLLPDRDERRRLGRAARERAASLNKDQVCGRLDVLYRELVR